MTELFEQQAAAFLQNYADQFLCMIQSQPGILCIFPAGEAGKQMGYRWMFLEQISAAIASGNDPMAQFLDGFLLYARTANRAVEAPFAVLSQDWSKCVVAMVGLKPVKRKKTKGFGRPTLQLKKGTS